MDCLRDQPKYAVKRTTSSLLRGALLKASLLNYILCFSVVIGSNNFKSLYFFIGFFLIFILNVTYHFMKLKRRENEIFFYKDCLINGDIQIHYSDIKKYQFIKMQNGNYQMELRHNKAYYCYEISEMGRDIIKSLLKED